MGTYSVSAQSDLEQGGVLEFDFALFDGERLICLIQYDGEEYFSPGADSKEVESSDNGGEQIKSRYCEDAGIPLIRISCLDVDVKRPDILQRDMSYILDMQLPQHIQD